MLERLFLAIEIPDSIKNSFIPINDEIKKIKGKVVPVENIHLTIKFIGETDKREDIIRVLEGSSIKSFKLVLKGVGVFPNFYNPRVFWVGVQESKELGELFNFIEERLHSIGIPRDDRSFSPHITLARFKFTPGSGLSKIIHDYKDFDFGDYRVDSFHLFKSELREPHPIYTKIYKFPLEI